MRPEDAAGREHLSSSVRQRLDQLVHQSARVSFVFLLANHEYRARHRRQLGRVVKRMQLRDAAYHRGDRRAGEPARLHPGPHLYHPPLPHRRRLLGQQQEREPLDITDIGPLCHGFHPCQRPVGARCSNRGWENEHQPLEDVRPLDSGQQKCPGTKGNPYSTPGVVPVLDRGELLREPLVGPCRLGVGGVTVASEVEEHARSLDARSKRSSLGDRSGQPMSEEGCRGAVTAYEYLDVAMRPLDVTQGLAVLHRAEDRSDVG